MRFGFDERWQPNLGALTGERRDGERERKIQPFIALTGLVYGSVYWSNKRKKFISIELI